jgi:hypothetical protein
MKKFLIIILIIIIALFVIVKISRVSRKESAPSSSSATPITPPLASEADITGCYVLRLAKDVYMLHIQSHDQSMVSGTLEFDNFEKDSSQGTMNGTYKDSILLVDYAFQSEGVDSLREVIFKREGDGFVEGFGPIIVSDEGKTVFVDTSTITFDPKYTFAREMCS